MTGRRVLSWGLALVLLAVIGVVVFRERLTAPPPLTVVTGVIGSEKAGAARPGRHVGRG